MRIGLLSAVAVVAFGGAAHAAVIAETLTGTITVSGNADTYGYDVADLFGGGNLYGATVTLSFSVDLGALDAGALSCHEGSGICQNTSGGSESYNDEANDGIFTESVTIGGGTYTVSNVNSPYNPRTYAESVLANCLTSYAEGCGYVAPVLRVYTNEVGSTQNQEIDENFYGVSGIPIGSLNDPAAIQNYMSGVTSAVLEIQNFDGTSEDIFNVSDLSISSTPEPVTWGLVVMGLGGSALIKRNRRALR